MIAINIKGSTLYGRGNNMTIGPIQFLVGVLDSPEYAGSIYHALADVREKGIIRLIDALAVSKDKNGEIQKVELSDFSKDEKIELGSALGALIGLGAGGEEGMKAGAAQGAEAVAERDYGVSSNEILNIANSLPLGKVAIFLLFEHTWAIDLKDAFRDQGGRLIAQGMITPESLMKAGVNLRQMELAH
jgi:uncharacterized membrane protein